MAARAFGVEPAGRATLLLAAIKGKRGENWGAEPKVVGRPLRVPRASERTATNEGGTRGGNSSYWFRGATLAEEQKPGGPAPGLLSFSAFPPRPRVSLCLFRTRTRNLRHLRSTFPPPSPASLAYTRSPIDPLSSGHPSIFLFRSQFARNRVRVPTRRASLKESGPPVNIYPRLKSNKARGRAEFTSVIKGRPEGFSRRADWNERVIAGYHFSFTRVRCLPSSPSPIPPLVGPGLRLPRGSARGGGQIDSRTFCLSTVSWSIVANRGWRGVARRAGQCF